LDAAKMRRRQIERQIEPAYLTVQEQRNSWIASHFGKRTRTEEDFWDRFAHGAVVPFDSDEYRAWEAATKAEDTARDDDLFYAWGFRKTNPNPLCILTAMFLHVGFLHVFGNMLF